MLQGVVGVGGRGALRPVQAVDGLLWACRR